jgi:hypothetical protein
MRTIIKGIYEENWENCNFLFTRTYLRFAWLRISWICIWITFFGRNHIQAQTTLNNINSTSKKQVIFNWLEESNFHQRINQVNVMSYMRWNKNFIFIQNRNQSVQNPANSVNRAVTWRGNSNTFAPFLFLHRKR